MPMTMSKKILAAHCGRSRVKPGDLIEARLDFVFANDIAAG
jgi:3-isopropylmalate/(R)-2-methylmalate dehydratase large subunit